MVYLNSEVIALGYLFLSFLYFNFNVIFFFWFEYFEVTVAIISILSYERKFFLREIKYMMFSSSDPQ